MRRVYSAIFATLLMSGISLPVHAQQILGGLIGTGEGSLINIGSGPASETGLVNLGLGGGGGNIADVNVGGTRPLANVNVSTGTSLADVEVGLLGGGVGVNANVGGPNLVGVGITVGGTPTGPGTPGVVPGQPGGPGVLANRGVGGAGCVGESPNQVARLIQGTRVDASWVRASNVAIKRVELCPEVKVWLSSQLAGSGLGPMLQNAVRGDALISASLSRSSFGPERVFAVKHSGSQLTVFVY